jgi:hypothetical protein
LKIEWKRKNCLETNGKGGGGGREKSEIRENYKERGRR